MVGRIPLIRLIAVASILSTCSWSMAQDGVLNGQRSYYDTVPRSASYPFLGGTAHRTTVVAPHEVHHVEGQIECGCGLAIIPALAQGLRDTLDCLFPCRGLNRGRGLLFSHRFDNGGCHGCGRVGHGVVYEHDGDGEPTPAQPAEIVPATPAAGLRPYRVPDDQSAFNHPPTRPGASLHPENTVIRPANFRIPVTVHAIERPLIPENPLRR